MCGGLRGADELQPQRKGVLRGADELKPQSRGEWRPGTRSGFAVCSSTGSGSCKAMTILLVGSLYYLIIRRPRTAIQGVDSARFDPCSQAMIILMRLNSRYGVQTPDCRPDPKWSELHHAYPYPRCNTWQTATGGSNKNLEDPAITDIPTMDIENND